MSVVLPKLRNHIDCVYTTQQGITGTPRSSYVIVDYLTGYRSPLTADEAEIVMALRRSTRELKTSELREEIRQSSGVEVADERIHEVIASLERLAMTGSYPDAAAVRERQHAARRAAHRASQLERLEKMLARLAADVPYYQEALERLGTRLERFEDLQRYPIITKADIRANLHRLQPRWFSADRFAVRWMSSSGSTDSRTQTVHLADEFNRGYSTGLHGLGLNLAVDSFRIAYLTPPVCSGSECHMDMALPYERRLMPNGRLLYLNSFRDPSTVPDGMLEAIVGEMHAFEPQLLAVDAAYLAAVARYLVRTGQRVPSVEAIVTSYGVSSGLHLAAIRDAFDCPIRDLYSMTETGPIAGNCGEVYHVLEPCHVEIVDGNGAAAGPDQVGKVLVTTIDNRLTPLLRYETGDLARVSERACPCSLAHTEVFADLEGRTSDLITSAAGGPVTPRAVDRAVTGCVGHDAVAYYSLVQIDDRGYQLVVAPAAGYGAAAEGALRDALHALLGADARIAVDKTASLPPARNGKYRLCYRER